MRICFDSKLPKVYLKMLGVVSDNRMGLKRREDFEVGFSVLLVLSFATPRTSSWSNAYGEYMYKWLGYPTAKG